MIGEKPTLSRAVDSFIWLRGALTFLHFDLDEYENLARKIGSHAAAEVVLLAVARQCKQDAGKWKRARNLGIPWLRKNWSALSRLQASYNEAVGIEVMPSVAEQVELSSSSGGMSEGAALSGSPITLSQCNDDGEQNMVGGPTACMAGGPAASGFALSQCDDDDEQSTVGDPAASMVGRPAASGLALSQSDDDVEQSMVGGPAGSTVGGPAAASLSPRPAPAADTGAYAPKPGLGVPAPFGLNSAPLGINPVNAAECPSPSQALARRSAAKSWRKSKIEPGRTELHFSKDVFAMYGMKISHFNATCKFSGHPKYEVYLCRPNDFDLDEVYSVPCGECSNSWIFINLKSAPLWGPDKKIWISKYLEKLGWREITNQANKRFVCKACMGSPVVVQ